jgi:small subunit ribosomal protein S9
MKDTLLSTGIGRRKTAVAIVNIYTPSLNEKPGIVINGCFADVFLQFNPTYLNYINLPLLLLNLESTYKIIIKTRGGGLTGQTGAIVLGLSRTLCSINPSYRSTLKAAGLLRRDPRSVECKKYGLKKARKASQYSKR